MSGTRNCGSAMAAPARRCGESSKPSTTADHAPYSKRTIDRRHDDADREAGRRIECPLLFLWAARDDLEYLYGDPLAIWRDWATDVRGQAVDCGHHIAEEAPAELAALLAEFFGA
jgi:pimeloyl-ACP methyl ester carboxylesterase